jgi:flavodoxin
MKISKVSLIYYSPTGTSKKIINGVAKGLGGMSVEYIDLTPLEAAVKNYIIPAAFPYMVDEFHPLRHRG